MSFFSRIIQTKWVAILVAALLVGCSQAPALTRAPAVAQPTARPTSTFTPGHSFQNPIYPKDFPDPFILPVEDGYYAYSTNSAGQNVPVIKISADFSQVDKLGDALPKLPAWAAANRSLTWAPAVLRRGSGYILYYTSWTKMGRHTYCGKMTATAAACRCSSGPSR